MKNKIVYADLLNIFADEWESESIYFRIILVITQPIRIIIIGLIMIAVFSYIFSGMGVFLILMCFIDGPVWMGWIILIFDLLLCVGWGYFVVTKKLNNG